ncbi:hypothetical protein AHMF7605_20115 [Adhaeribacter arboris]|uniref:Uncharacterized protein n=1 Tax=Adhaeribacter arboris TaxID=2072846 RepID=A0A2T2YJF8_9BACT|nr:hypothetical protein [Adhaeribacter arboris]PSR55646.1 hypothetical protein AHMF7605_20115 [Adhaeribacter arboris]
MIIFPLIPLVVLALLVIFLVVRQVISEWRTVQATFHQAESLTQELRQFTQNTTSELEQLHCALDQFSYWIKLS